MILTWVLWNNDDNFLHYWHFYLTIAMSRNLLNGLNIVCLSWKILLNDSGWQFNLKKYSELVFHDCFWNLNQFYVLYTTLSFTDLYLTRRWLDKESHWPCGVYLTELAAFWFGDIHHHVICMSVDFGERILSVFWEKMDSVGIAHQGVNWFFFKLISEFD